MSKKLFDFVIGNPPYQEEMEGTRDKPVYDVFMDEAYRIADKVELITPARFLFNAGATSKAWNNKMLNDTHLKVLEYKQDATYFFPNVTFSGGVAITYRDETEFFGAIEQFSVYPEVNGILDKLKKLPFQSFSTIMYGQGSYKYTQWLHDDHPEIRYCEDDAGNNVGILSKGHDYDIATSALEKLDGIVMFETKPDDGNEYVQIVGRKNNNRGASYIRREYINNHPNLDYYKVILSKADGAAGTLGKPVPARICGKASVIMPQMGHTQTFLSIGCFKTMLEAENVTKYVATKFARCLLGTLKATQDNPPEKWARVPLQDFTSASDIDWAKSIHDIDLQLYRKYNLSKEEIDFIESNVKEMV